MGRVVAAHHGPHAVHGSVTDSCDRYRCQAHGTSNDLVTVVSLAPAICGQHLPRQMQLIAETIAVRGIKNNKMV